MKENEERKPRTVEDWQDYIYKYIERWEVGSPQHQALNDVINLKHIYMAFGEFDDTYQGFIAGDQKLTKEQREFRDLQRIALLEHTIEHNTGVLPGYQDANIELNAALDDLVNTATDEAEAKLSGDREAQDQYVSNAYRETLGHASDYLRGVQFTEKTN